MAQVTEQRAHARTTCAEETHALGRALGSVVTPGTVIGLSGTLGAGKTVFVRGFAEGLGIDTSEVSSPTYSIVQSYLGGRMPLHHADLYRLETQADLDAVGLVDLFTADAVVVVEWHERIKDSLPADALFLRLEAPSPGSEERLVSVRGIGANAGPVLSAWRAALGALVLDIS